MSSAWYISTSGFNFLFLFWFFCRFVVFFFFYYEYLVDFSAVSECDLDEVF